jgi:long-chain acyl-CoA synthetase
MRSRKDIISLIRQHAELHPGQIAYSEGKDRLTYAELMFRADEIAARLRARGCKPGERCGLILVEGLNFLAAALGILAAGLCLAPVDPSLPEAEIDFVLTAAGLHWLFQSKQRLLQFPFALAVDGQRDREFRACDPAYIRFTSGSTGPRKGVLLGHETILQRLSAANEILEIGTGDTVWFNLPMVDHFVVSTLLYLSRGATIISANHPNQWERAAEQATIIYGAPDFYRSLVNSPVGRLSALRLAISTTAPLPANVATQFSTKFGLPLNPALGMIELGLLTINLSREKPDSVGLIMPSYIATILGEDGKPVGPNEIGELQIDGKGLLDAYIAPWRPRNHLLQTFGFPTGDYALRDEEGYLFIVGRDKNRLSVEGVQFFCEEVESILNRLPGVEESRVFIDSGTLSAQLVGAIESTIDIPDLLLDHIDPRKIPKRFSLVRDLPRTPNGKLRRVNG